MSTESYASAVNRRHFLAVASGVAAASSISVGKALASPLPPQVSAATYVVNVNVAAGFFSYSVSSSASPSANPRRLSVSAGDTVKWTATTGSTRHRLTILFLKDTPFIDPANKRPVFAFHGNESDEAGVGIGGSARIDGLASGAYEYSVAVFDDNSIFRLTYTDDPKIIVGSGNILTANGDIVRESKLEPELDEVLGEVKQLTPSGPDQRRKVEAIEDKLETLIKQLK